MASIDWNFYTTSMGRIQNLMLFKLDMKKSIMSVFRLPKKKKPNHRKNSKPWILDLLQCACNRKNQLYKTFVKEATD